MVTCKINISFVSIVRGHTARSLKQQYVVQFFDVVSLLS